jgi:uncharacterized membrane-anchored protein
MNVQSQASPAPDHAVFNKVAQVSIFFWIAKIMATTVGETGADFLIFQLKFGLANTAYLMSALLLVVLAFQIRLRRYLPWLYWGAVVMVSIVGTLITDSLVDNFGVRLETTTLVFTLALLVAFGLWYAREKTLSVQTITTVPRELFYWLAILLTFALGTAAGDLLSERWQLGYLVSGLIFAGMIAVVAIAYYTGRLGAVAAFWIAYVLTRPLGASVGDWLTQPAANGGLGIGTTPTSIAFVLVIVGLLAFSSLGSKPAPLAATMPSGA